MDVEAVIAKTDLIDLVLRAGGVPKKYGKEHRTHCPLHGGDNPTGFAIYEEGGKQKWICFTRQCGNGDVVDFVRVWQNKTFVDAIEFLGGDTLADPFEMERLANERHERAVREREAAQQREAARRKELQLEQKHLLYHQNLNDYFIGEWTKRGLDETWQGFFCLGGCSDFIINDNWHTPTLTIPIQDEKYEILNIKHRLLNPQNPKDKYRPEKTGLGQFPYFLSYPDLGYGGSVIWILEGEIKSMVAASINPNSEWQYIGVPGVSQYKGLVDKLFGKNVIVVSDPGAEEDASLFCKAVKGRFVEVPDKVDDLIVAHGYDGDWLLAIEKQARRL